MGSAAGCDLNVSGEEGITRVVSSGASHFSRGQSTRQHAHYAWKVHIGIDAPVWACRESDRPAPSAEARVLVVPPNVVHATGAVGWSVAMFASPGKHGFPSAGPQEPWALDGAHARRVIDACRGLTPEMRETLPEHLAEVSSLVFDPTATSGGVTKDARVSRALSVLRKDPSAPLGGLAASNRLSLDRLSHIVREKTGMTLRAHVLWSRVLNVLSAESAPSSLAEAAAIAGFSDHAHMTRTFRRFLGRAPSDFTVPVDVIAPW